jgi:imidazolonepropionase-like amidohydrolase
MMRLLAAAALVGATVYTGEGEPLEGATVVVRGERVVAVGQDVRVPDGATVIDAAGGVITPGLVDVASRLGTTEIRSEAQAIEATAGHGLDAVHASLRAWDTYNPASIVIPVARLGGLTSAVVVPTGGLISGQSAWIDLVAEDVRTGGALRRAPVALHVSLRAWGNEVGSRARRIMRLREVLADARLYRANRGPYIGRRLRELSLGHENLEVLARVVDRELPVVFHVDRAAEIRSVLELAREERIRAVLLGASEGWKLADEIAAARVPAIVDPLHNLPSSFDQLESRGDNALILHRAGVEVAFQAGAGPHLVHRLRWSCGHAIALGFPREAALAAVTRVPAHIFGIERTGVLRAGAVANLVVWTGDPFEVTTWPTRVFVRGQEIDLETRQDLLTERYR